MSFVFTINLTNVIHICLLHIHDLFLKIVDKTSVAFEVLFLWKYPSFNLKFNYNTTHSIVEMLKWDLGPYLMHLVDRKYVSHKMGNT